MGRIPIVKALHGTKLANDYGGWIYCEACNQTIGYLCYVTYDAVDFEYECTCGGRGSMHIAFKSAASLKPIDQAMITLKNRLCCPQDQSPLITILQKKLKTYHCEIVCTACNNTYVEGSSP